MVKRADQLRAFLDPLQAKYHAVEYLGSDPLEFAHRYSDPYDQEAVALIGALLAYGNVKQIRRSVEDALRRIHAVSPRGPAEFVRSQEVAPELGTRAFRGFVHRFNRGEDLALLSRLLSRSWREHGSLGAHFVSKLEPGDRSFAGALDALIDEWRDWAGPRLASTSFSYLLTAPRDGSACKRWCMFLRWMGRRDRLDLGLWSRGGALASTFPQGRWLSPAQLVIPMDTHTGRISRYLGLTSRKSLNWLAAVEVTESLRACHAEDPTRYDFAISRLGILDLCQRKFRPEICVRCELLPVCRYARRRGAGRERREPARRIQAGA